MIELLEWTFMILQPGVQGITPGSEMFVWNFVNSQGKDKK